MRILDGNGRTYTFPWCPEDLNKSSLGMLPALWAVKHCLPRVKLGVYSRNPRSNVEGQCSTANVWPPVAVENWYRYQSSVRYIATAMYDGITHCCQNHLDKSLSLHYLLGRQHLTALLGSLMVNKVRVTTWNMQAASNMSRCCQVGPCASVGVANGKIISVRDKLPVSVLDSPWTPILYWPFALGKSVTLLL